jgi:hypothetical protein
MSKPLTTVRFVDNVPPPLPAADYLLEVKQTVQLTKDQEPPEATYPAAKQLRIVGPHFGLAADDVASVYPSANSQSDYEDVLPAVTLASRSLPWQIHIGGPLDGPLVAPWCALLLLTPEEIRVPVQTGAAAGSATGTQVVPLAEYLTPRDAFGPQFSPVQKEGFLRQYPDLQVSVVDVSAEAFAAVAPGLAELPYLAHARESATDDQEIDGRYEDGWVATVLANRLPVGSPSGVYVAHLVSLEGFAGVLPGSGALPPSADTVRLVSLTSWSFNSISGGDDFAAIMAHLDSTALTMPLPMADLQPGPQHEVARALGLGYTAVRYETRLGETTTGWYRGPCIPVPMERNVQPAYAAAESALIYDWDPHSDASTGLFDLSFGVAWQTGRLAALADRQFVTALLAWARRNNAIAQLLAERMTLLQTCTALDLPHTVAELMAPGLMREHTRRFLAQTFAPMLATPDPRATGDVHPLLARPRPLLGPPRDPSRMLQALDRYPGVTPPGAFLSALLPTWPAHRTAPRSRDER